MEDQKRYFLSVVLLLTLIVGVAAFQHPLKERFEVNRSMSHIDMEEANNSPVSTVFLEGNKTLAELQLEKAETREERKNGLMNRRSLDNDSGMLFIWDDSSNRTFWMKNTYIPLDIIFVTAEKTIRAIQEAEPQPNVTEENLELYSSEGPAKYVIETNRNFTDQEGIEKGDKVSFNLSD
ncbi:MAG: hypothetical protein J07AB43_10550 [Candidatus Nanosalina sp. J07AB43]|nr:MAG: hypothetical protein J07AB43_10550 [Candidatus Nanosalina sp. J07AB43]